MKTWISNFEKFDVDDTLTRVHVNFLFTVSFAHVQAF